jgi:hypothetical protein
MPAPDRPTPHQNFASAINPAKGIVGYYSDAEVDALLAALPTGGGLQTVDLSAYATTAYVDGQIATLYSKAEVDAAITAAIAGVVTGGTVDLNGYATEQFVTDAIAAIPPASLDGPITGHAGTTPQPTAATPQGLEDAFKDYADGLHYFDGSGALVAIQRQQYQTTIVINGSVRSVTKIVKSEAGLPTPQNPSTLTQNDGGQWLRLASDELDKPFAPVGVVDLFNLPAGADGERPAVYESPTAPAGDLKDGDLWLAPATTSVAAKQLGTLSLSDPACAAFRQSVMDEVRKMISGGKTVPADIDWAPCTKVAGSGLIEARVLNGMIQLRGELTYTMTAIGSLSTVQRLPANFPKPPVEQTVLVFGFESGVAYRRVFLRFQPDGGIAICGDGKITGTSFNGAQAYAY